MNQNITITYHRQQTLKNNKVGSRNQSSTSLTLPPSLHHHYHNHFTVIITINIVSKVSILKSESIFKNVLSFHQQVLPKHKSIHPQWPIKVRTYYANNILFYSQNETRISNIQAFYVKAFKNIISIPFLPRYIPKPACRFVSALLELSTQLLIFL